VFILKGFKFNVLEVFILKRLRAHFAEVLILKELWTWRMGCEWREKWGCKGEEQRVGDRRAGREEIIGNDSTGSDYCQGNGTKSTAFELRRNKGNG